VDRIDLPGNALFFDPAAYTAARSEAKKTRDKGGVKKSAFARLLDQQNIREAEEASALPDYPPSEQALQELLDDVHSAGDALRLRPLGDEIKRYKQAVRHFMRYVVENGYGVERHEGVPNYVKPRYKGHAGDPNRMERTIYTRILVVDQKLEQLAAGILSGQIAQVELLSRLDEITGLLVDLMQ
jgi:uncharacterized protein YaaR (DUF327 family)